MQLFKKDLSFYDMLEAQAQAGYRAAREFHSLTKDFSNSAEYAQKLKEIEHEADEITHRLANKIDSTFVTPLDKEDLNTLSSALDDITDTIEAAAARISLYRLTEARPDLEPIAGKLVLITQATHEAVSALRDMPDRNGMHDVFLRIHQAENDSDHVYRQVLADLFNTPNPDVLLIIKWKEIFDRIEIAIDMCERVSDIIESVVIKYA